MSKSYLNGENLPRGYRNNNPGNIRYNQSNNWDGKIPFSQNKDWSGTSSNIVRHFEQFTELRFGIRALMKVIMSYHNQGRTTIVQIITRYAPAFENNTAAYINMISAAIGYGANQVIPALDRSTLIALCKAIIRVENGNAYGTYVTDSDYDEAYAILGTPLADSKKKAR